MREKLVKFASVLMLSLSIQLQANAAQGLTNEHETWSSKAESLCLTSPSVSKHTELDFPNLQGGLKNLAPQKKNSILNAYKTGYASYNGSSAFIGYYAEGVVITILNDPSGSFIPLSQIICYGPELTPISISNSWYYETVNGVALLTHEHAAFTVKTVHESQYIVLK